MRLRRTILAAAVLMAGLSPMPARANPIGPTVVNGSVSIATSGGTLTVTNSPNSIINWQAFGIAAGETTRFVQQTTASAVLNRVTGGGTSAILGSLASNGHVFLVNPNGILFGAGSQVNVGALTASTQALGDASFLSGSPAFGNSGAAAAIGIEGAITAAGGITLNAGALNVTNATLNALTIQFNAPVPTTSTGGVIGGGVIGGGVIGGGVIGGGGLVTAGGSVTLTPTTGALTLSASTGSIAVSAAGGGQICTTGGGSGGQCGSANVSAGGGRLTLAAATGSATSAPVSFVVPSGTVTLAGMPAALPSGTFGTARPPVATQVTGSLQAAAAPAVVTLNLEKRELSF